VWSSIHRAPDPGWLPFIKLFFGFALLFLTVILAIIIATHKVEQSTSYGLPYILGALSTLCGGFAQWAFGTYLGPKKNTESTNKED
jgi:thiol:disulfide interchange protein